MNCTAFLIQFYWEVNGGCIAYKTTVFFFFFVLLKLEIHLFQNWQTRKVNDPCFIFFLTEINNTKNIDWLSIRSSPVSLKCNISLYLWYWMTTNKIFLWIVKKSYRCVLNWYVMKVRKRVCCRGEWVTPTYKIKHHHYCRGVCGYIFLFLHLKRITSDLVNYFQWKRC